MHHKSVPSASTGDNVGLNVISSGSRGDRFMVHFHCKHLSSAGSGSRVSGEEENFVVGLHNALFNATSKNVTNTLDLVDSGDRNAHGLVGGTLWHSNHLVKSIQQGINMQRFAVNFNVASTPPAHVG